MSKRETAQIMKDGFSIYLTDLEALGYLPEATVNWIALMGWSYDDHTEFFTMPELIERFSMERLNPAPAAINFTKFDHFNGLHIRRLQPDELARRLKPFFKKAGYDAEISQLEKIAPIIQERIGGLDEAPQIAGFFFQEEVHPQREDLIGKNMTSEETQVVLSKALEAMEKITVFDPVNLEPPMRKLVEDLGLNAGQVFGILRIAITGQKVSPPLFESMEIIGREKCLERVNRAMLSLES
jgi:glutamyl-tRNA synthetase